MLEFFTWKKVKGHKDATTAEASASSAETKAVPSGPQPVLSQHDEAFLREQLESADDEPVVILSGDSGASTPVPSPLPTPVPAQAPAPVTEGKVATAEWTAGIKSRFGDLRRSVSSAADRRKKGKSPGPEKEEKEKEKGKGEGKGKGTLKVEEEVKVEGGILYHFVFD